jgi:hypothetical protein
VTEEMLDEAVSCFAEAVQRCRVFA